MDMISSYLASTHAQLMQTVQMSVADMAMNGTAAQMSTLVEQMTEAVPAPVPVDGLGANVDTYA